VRQGSIGVLKGWLGKNESTGKLSNVDIVVNAYSDWARGEAQIRQKVSQIGDEPATHGEQVEEHLTQMVARRRALRDAAIISTRVAELALWNERGVGPEQRIHDTLPAVQLVGPFRQYLESDYQRIQRNDELGRSQETIKTLESEMSVVKKALEQAQSELDMQNQLLNKDIQLLTQEKDVVIQKLVSMEAQMELKVQVASQEAEIRIRREFAETRPAPAPLASAGEEGDHELLVVTDRPVVVQTASQRGRQVALLEEMLHELKISGLNVETTVPVSNNSVRGSNGKVYTITEVTDVMSMVNTTDATMGASVGSSQSGLGHKDVSLAANDYKNCLRSPNYDNVSEVDPEDNAGYGLEEDYADDSADGSGLKAMIALEMSGGSDPMGTDGDLVINEGTELQSAEAVLLTGAGNEPGADFGSTF
jgi:hypothetical protein